MVICFEYDRTFETQWNEFVESFRIPFLFFQKRISKVLLEQIHRLVADVL